MRRTLGPIAIAVLLSAGCGQDDESAILTVTEEGTVTVEQGESFRIQLEASQTTPYRWHLSKVPDPAIVDFVTSDYEADPGSEDVEGAGGASIWEFRAVGPGTTTIGLAYVEIGEDVPDVSDFSVTVDVLPVAELES